MSTSFSTIRSSNCWILKSFRLKAVLHSGHAAEGLVNNASTQFSHLATNIQVSFVRSWERTKQTHFLIWRENTLIKTTWSQIWINVQNASNFSWNLDSMKFKNLQFVTTHVNQKLQLRIPVFGCLASWTGLPIVHYLWNLSSLSAYFLVYPKLIAIFSTTTVSLFHVLVCEQECNADSLTRYNELFDWVVGIVQRFSLAIS